MTNLSIMSNYMKAETQILMTSLLLIYRQLSNWTEAEPMSVAENYYCTLVLGVIKSSIIKSSLYRHVKLKHRSGGGTTVFVCNHPGCVKIFNQSYGLYRHFKLEHNGEKPYKCFECDQMFA